MNGGRREIKAQGHRGWGEHTLVSVVLAGLPFPCTSSRGSVAPWGFMGLGLPEVLSILAASGAQVLLQIGDDESIREGDSGLVSESLQVDDSNRVIFIYA